MNYIYKNVYFMNSFIEFEEPKIPLFMTSRTVKFKMFADFEKLLNEDKFIISSSSSHLRLNIIYSPMFVEDGYDMEITSNEINIKVSNYRGIRYAFQALNEIAIVDNKAKLPIIKISDAPSFKYRGIIEGYYGTPWSFEERMDMVDFMDKQRLNCYMYAPKSDLYHREKWFELYPSDEINKIITLKDALEDKGIDFFYCISPGHATNKEDSFNFVGEKDFNRLFKKLDQVIEKGINKFGLLLDDIDYQLSGESLRQFKRPGIAHSFICNKVYSYLQTRVNDLEFVMCPTEYHQIGYSEYRNDLKERLDHNIMVFWTGDNVCAEVITDEQVGETKDAFGHQMMIWDNFPVSDFTYGVRQFIAPIINRTVSLGNYALGYIINPMNLYEISKISMITQSHYAWNSSKYSPDLSFDIALKSFGEDFYNYSKAYIEYNYPNVLNYGNLAYEKKLVVEQKYSEIKDYINKVSTSAKKLLTLDLKIIHELTPWLKRVINEEKIINEIIDQVIKKEDLLEFLKDIKFSGSEILDYLILDKKLLNDEEYQELIKKRRGNKWYRVWEERK